MCFRFRIREKPGRLLRTWTLREFHVRLRALVASKGLTAGSRREQLVIISDARYPHDNEHTEQQRTHTHTRARVRARLPTRSKRVVRHSCDRNSLITGQSDERACTEQSRELRFNLVYTTYTRHSPHFILNYTQRIIFGFN